MLHVKPHEASANAILLMNIERLWASMLLIVGFVLNVAHVSSTPFREMQR